MKINCLSCGHKIDLGDAYDDYKGLVKCFICNTLLEIRTEEGSLKSVKLLTGEPQVSTRKALVHER